MSDQPLPTWARRLASERQTRGWTQLEMVRHIRSASDAELPDDTNLLRMWKNWERGRHKPRTMYQRLIALALGSIPDALFGQSPHRPAELISAADHHPRQRASTDDVDQLRASVRQLVTLDTQYGGDDVVRLAVRAFQGAYGRLASGLYVPQAERDLQAVTGELGQVAAWIAYDADQQELSRRLNQDALLTSRLAGDRPMELFQLANLAMQSVHLHRSAEALRIADDILDDGLSRRTVALFLVRRARALAQTGQAHRSLDALDHSESLLLDSVAPNDPRWTWWLDNSELAWHRAMCLVDLGERSLAVDLFQAAYQRRPPTARRARFNDLAHLLEAQVALSDWPSVDETAQLVVPQVRDIASQRTAVILRRSAQNIAHADGAPSSLRDVADELTRLITDA